MKRGGTWGFASSTGQDFTHSSIVDAHFRACLPAYRTLLGQAGITAGQHVLDAGCGSGSFLPWLAALVGPQGSVSAIDLAAEHVELARRQVPLWNPPCPVEVEVGDIVSLPFPDASVDAVWCANTVQYLDDAALRTALGEMRRVLRPGGRVAVKDLDPALITVRPGDRFLFTDFFRQEARSPGYARQLLRSADLFRWLDEAGFVQVRQRTVLIEHFAPLSPEAKEFYGASSAKLAEQALRQGMPGHWSRFTDPDDPDNPLNHPHGYISEGNVLAVARKPSTGRIPPKGTTSAR
ncbi:class I SAM-dependent methyltransferase [Actinomadura fibrosa]|uniref:Class I SAM-dependent methyltransferase n=1 Tax=Actinomadura fibrosa TaxID=111802 RepID=A0ABW2XTC1_9ACTN|nr:class I SAM-dependent methyltransferase [Actinomadura fibrosa]